MARWAPRLIGFAWWGALGCSGAAVVSGGPTAGASTGAGASVAGRVSSAARRSAEQSAGVESPRAGAVGSASRAVLACESDVEIVVAEAPASGSVLRRRTLSGSVVATVASQSVAARMDLSSDGRWVAGDAGVSLAASASAAGRLAWRSMIGAQGWIEPRFLPGGSLVVAWRERPVPASPTEILIVDHATARLVTRFAGRAPSVASDGSVTFLRDGPLREGAPEYVSVHQKGKGALRELKRISLDGAHAYGVTEVVALGGDRFLYRVYDEHEYHYHDQDGRAFAPARDRRGAEWRGREGQLPTGKEQYDLRLSSDGALAVLAERNWNELTYLVVVDMASRERRRLPVFGAFPALVGHRVVFSSDPAFVTNAEGGERAFRPISSWALYAYDLDDDSLCIVGEYPHPVAAS